MSTTFAIGDIHGRLDLLLKAFEFIRTFPCIQKKIVTLGDYIDRGPDSALVVYNLRNFEDPLVDSLVCLKGNHEDLMLNDPACWMYNGGTQTIESYNEFPRQQMNDDMAWMETLPTIHEDKHRIFVHAAYFTEEECAKHGEDVDHMRMWYRYGPNEDPKPENGKFIVHGHTPQRAPVVLNNRANIDIGSCYYGQIAVAVFDDDIPGKPRHVEVIDGRFN